MKCLHVRLFACLFIWLCMSIDARVVDIRQWGLCCQSWDCEIVARLILHYQIDNPRYKRICQMYKNRDRFATLYDTQNRIPVFSHSFNINKNGGGGRPNRSRYYIEPQLEVANADGNMSGEKTRVWYANQATNADYRNSMWYDRGHLYPSATAMTDDDKIATFTLTNVIPQISSLNQWCWSKVERAIRTYAGHNTRCTSHSVVVGAIPGIVMLNERVNIPSFIWSYVSCGGNSKTVGFLVPNELRRYIQTWMKLYVFLEENVGDFLSKIFFLYQQALISSLELYPDITILFSQQQQKEVRSAVIENLLMHLNCEIQTTQRQNERFQFGGQAQNPGGQNDNNRKFIQSPTHCGC